MRKEVLEEGRKQAKVNRASHLRRKRGQVGRVWGLLMKDKMPLEMCWDRNPEDGGGEWSSEGCRDSH